MFDFDAFYQAHYGEQLERERRLRGAPGGLPQDAGGPGQGGATLGRDPRLGFRPRSAHRLPHRELSYLIGEWRAGRPQPTPRRPTPPPPQENGLACHRWACLHLSTSAAGAQRNCSPPSVAHLSSLGIDLRPTPPRSRKGGFRCSRKQAPNEES